jgi:hypothetical protein
MKIEIGTELNVNGKWCIVDNVYENVAFAIDQDGGEIEITLDSTSKLLTIPVKDNNLSPL